MTSSTSAVRDSSTSRPWRASPNCCCMRADSRRYSSFTGRSSYVPPGLTVAALEGTGTTFVIANPYGIVNAREKNFAVADLARAGSIRDDLNNLFRALFRYHQLNLDLRQKVHGVFPSTIELRVS